MGMEKIYSKIAEDYGISAGEVRQEIQETIEDAYIIFSRWWKGENSQVRDRVKYGRYASAIPQVCSRR